MNHTNCITNQYITDIAASVGTRCRELSSPCREVSSSFANCFLIILLVYIDITYNIAVDVRKNRFCGIRDP